MPASALSEIHLFASCCNAVASAEWYTQYVEGDIVDLYKESQEYRRVILRRILGEEN